MRSWILSAVAAASIAAWSAPARALPVVALPDPGFAESLQPVRWVQRCHEEMVRRRDDRGRRMMVPRQICRRVWVGGRR